MEVVYSPRFARAYRKLPERIKILAEEAEIIFRKNPFHPRLKTHKLRGSLKGLHAFSIDQKYRIIFEFSSDAKTVYLHDVGDHAVY